MKHIFTIHSHITFLAALGTIKLENIKPKSVIILCNANYKPTLPEKLYNRYKLYIDAKISNADAIIGSMSIAS